MGDDPKEPSSEQRGDLLKVLEARFESHPNRHAGLGWAEVRARLEARPEKLWSLGEMERTGGEPDAMETDLSTGEVVFFDCAAESPKGRRSLCYDRAALDARKESKPESNAMDMAASMGVEILTEEEYRLLQTRGAFDLKTSSWLKTPDKIRALGGAIFGDRRYDTVFTFHNGADSYYASRGFRGRLRV